VRHCLQVGQKTQLNTRGMSQRLRSSESTSAVGDLSFPAENACVASRIIHTFHCLVWIWLLHLSDADNTQYGVHVPKFFFPKCVTVSSCAICSPS
jgi:hypothetical protein